ncbi:hypothetical protein PPL_04681 [Heterostelium album PN500]|uniref:MYND-type domain-containing protein n=1 Tax=Heterostelium pallidum (strain ATCC 26659 / Pp 5 / PN500) TaxID=670386 RepID=D3B890_HETP5|nr:hypothetical protein PPL_04681 [Heterostelium album PN500]EFA82258.1 hypothetical protein PPL_04681 [Heterostelium album PN500]|eukprot:XP_020434375.1 hypothetical protein PPL_04681 [Heterostelium album PN500]
MTLYNPQIENNTLPLSSTSHTIDKPKEWIWHHFELKVLETNDSLCFYDIRPLSSKEISNNDFNFNNNEQNDLIIKKPLIFINLIPTVNRMASVYTTKRGKTKKAKLGIRKDASNNAANKFTQRMKADISASKSAELPAWQLRQQEIALKLKGTEETGPKLALTSKCASPVCTSKNVLKLSLCGSCTSVSYCSRDCQVGHWPEHKELCKKIAAEKAESTNAILEQLIQIETKVKENKTNKIDKNSDEHKKRLEELGLVKKPIDTVKSYDISSTTTTTTSTTTTATSNISQKDSDLASHIDKSLFINDDIEDLPEISDDEDQDE